MNPERMRPAMTLAMKYDFTSIKNDIISKIKMDWPITLEQWDVLQYEMDLFSATLLRGESEEALDDHFPEPVSALHFAKDFNIPAILPAAFYMLSHLAIMNDWYERRLPDTSILQLAQTARWKDLTGEEYHRLLRGKHNLKERWEVLRPSFVDVFNDAICDCDDQAQWCVLLLGPKEDARKADVVDYKKSNSIRIVNVANERAY